jgi:hypothetical protein
LIAYQSEGKEGIPVDAAKPGRYFCFDLEIVVPASKKECSSPRGAKPPG